MQFVGQTHLIRVPLPHPRPTREELQSLFEAAYFARFRVELATIRANLVNLNTSVIGHRPELSLATLIDPSARRPTLAEARTAIRPVRFGGAWHDTPVYWRDHLPRDRRLQRTRHHRADGHHHRHRPGRAGDPGRGRESADRDCRCLGAGEKWSPVPRAGLPSRPSRV